MWILMTCDYTQSCGKSLKGFKQSVKMIRLEIWKYELAALWRADCRRGSTPWEAGGRLFSAVEMKVVWTEVDGGGLGLWRAKLGTKLKLDKISDSSWWYFHVNMDNGKACEMAVSYFYWCFTFLMESLMKIIKLTHRGNGGGKQKSGCKIN